MKPLVLLLASAAALAAQSYPLGPDSRRQPGVPEGRIEQFDYTSPADGVYPGTERPVWVYIPEQYTDDEPAPVMVFQDGHSFIRTEGDRAWRTPVVLDNLIADGQMPPVIGVFVKWGVLPADGEGKRERYNRSYEYDGLGPRYARFLEEEILPEVARRFDLNLTDDPNLRGVGGSSSGGIAAFTAAWERPDLFRRVLSFIGSYTDLRGGHLYPGLVRKTEPKRLRIFLQDGRNDLNIYSGSWFIQNQALARALDFAGYDVRFEIGDEAHNNIHGRSILPDALAWLWRDAGEPIEANKKVTGDRQWVNEFLDPSEDWELVSDGHTFTEGPAVAPNGDVFFSDVRESKIFRIDAETADVSLFLDGTGHTNGLMFGPDGRLYSCRRDSEQIVAIDVETKEEEVVSSAAEANDIVVDAAGNIYFSSPWNKQVWYVPKGGEPRVVFEDEQAGFLNGVMLSPDQSLLMVNDTRSKWVWSFQVLPDGSLGNGEKFYRLATWDESSHARSDGMTIASSGHLLVATELGVQVLDQPGRVVAIFSKPSRNFLSNLVFAGPELRTLYATAEGEVYRRKVRMQGVLPWKPVTPPVPRL